MGALHENLERLKERLRDAERASSRPLGSVQLLPVTKSADPRLTLELARAGELELAENRVSGLEEKASHIWQSFLPETCTTTSARGFDDAYKTVKPLPFLLFFLNKEKIFMQILVSWF